MAIHPIEYRYGTPEMKSIWETENKLQRKLDVESALAQAEGKLGIIPQEVADEIAAKANTKYVKLEREDEIEAQTKHDIAALVKAIGEVCDNDAGEYVHFGATSNDVVDSSNSLLLNDSIEVLKEKVEIGEDETTGELWDRLSKIGGKLLVETLKQIEDGTPPREKQGEEFTMAPMLNKEMSKINWRCASIFWK